MNEQPTKQGFKLSEVIIIVIITCTFSIFAGISYGKIKYSEVININNLSEEKNEDLEKFITQYKYIINNYYEPSKIDEEQLLSKALASIIKELGISDPYSLYMNEEDYNEFNINLDGEYEGLGVGVSKDKDGEPIIINYTINNSPASKEKLQKDDIILAIDGKDTAQMSVQEFCNYILDSNDKSFLLKIKRKGEEFSLNIKKGQVELSSVNSKVINQDNKKVGYIGISIFASNTHSQFKTQLKDLEKENIDSLIIDVRNNTGGHLKEASKIISLFLSKSNVIYQLQKGDEKVKYYSNGKENKKYPLVILANKNTASASEVLILSLKENLKAKIVGEKTYGKGTVQELIELSNGDKYKITTKKWLSPKGNWVNDTKGIVPDIEVKNDSSNLNGDNDKQLQEAINTAIKLNK